MIIHDSLYGNANIQSSILFDLIRSKPMQRLKNINQAGISGYIIPWKKVSRLDHSIGVMILLKTFSANLKEQIAGLIHDVSHTAFSHVADFVFPNADHEFHEWHYKRFVLRTEIALILKKYNG